MKLLLATCAVSLALGYGAAVQAQDVQPPSGAQVAQEHASPMLTGAEGQLVYDMDGNEIGQISAIDMDARGNEGAVVETDQRLAMGVKQVLIPTASLQPKQDGGFVTNLGHAAIAALPAFRHSTSQQQIQ